MIIHADPSIASDNIGDSIISRSIRGYLKNTFPNQEIVAVPTQLVTASRRLNRLFRSAKAIIIGGSNLLSFRYPRIHQWANVHQFVAHRKKIHLLGVGWHSYEDIDWYANKMFYRYLLQSGVHSVRDEYSRSKLVSAGVECINTSCPTLWTSPRHIAAVEKPKNIVFTLTYYRRNKERDARFVNELVKLSHSRSANLKFWPQSEKDRIYLSSIGCGVENIEILPPTLSSFEEILSEESIYIGTRLHGGIHAMKRSVPAFIYSIDNRSSEMGRDFNISVFSEVSHIGSIIECDISLKLPDRAIEKYTTRLVEAVGA